MWSHARSCIRTAAFSTSEGMWSSRPTPERLSSPVLGCALGLPSQGQRGDTAGSVLLLSGGGRAEAWLYQGSALAHCQQARSPPPLSPGAKVLAMTNVAGGAVLLCSDAMYLYDEACDDWWKLPPEALPPPDEAHLLLYSRLRRQPGAGRRGGRAEGPAPAQQQSFISGDFNDE